jgi:uncharacterized protein (DUF1499 family)
MGWIQWIVGIALALVLLVVGAGQLGLLSGRTPQDLGVRDGKLARPSKTDNSVSSQARLWPGEPAQAAHIDPIVLPAGVQGQAAMRKLEALVASTPGMKVVQSKPDYLHAQCTTPLMKYVDDLELWFDGSVVQVRSASRVGRKDFGVNRARVEALRANFSR